VWGYIWVSALFGIVNTIVGSILRLLTLPLTVITLGISLFFVNAIVLEIVDWITDDLTIDDFFWTAIWAAVILATAQVVLQTATRFWFARR
jgi:putative membrane protein